MRHRTTRRETQRRFQVVQRRSSGHPLTRTTPGRPGAIAGSTAERRRFASSGDHDRTPRVVKLSFTAADSHPERGEELVARLVRHVVLLQDANALHRCLIELGLRPPRLRRPGERAGEP